MPVSNCTVSGTNIHARSFNERLTAPICVFSTLELDSASQQLNVTAHVIRIKHQVAFLG